MDSKLCEHLVFRADVDVTRIQDDKTGDVTSWSADIRVKCIDCQEPFRFLGAPVGVSPYRPMASFDGKELRAPIKPVSDPNPGSGPEVRMVVRDGG